MKFLLQLENPAYRLIMENLTCWERKPPSWWRDPKGWDCILYKMSDLMTKNWSLVKELLFAVLFLPKFEVFAYQKFQHIFLTFTDNIVVIENEPVLLKFSSDFLFHGDCGCCDYSFGLGFVWRQLRRKKKIF